MVTLRTLFAATFALSALPALAHTGAPLGHQAGDPTPAGCVRVNKHVPAGKIAHAPARIRCDQRTPVVAAQATHPRAPLTPAAAHD